MNTSVQSYSAPKPTALLRFSPVISRLPLAIVVIVFTLISVRHLLNPVGTAASQGLSVVSPQGITMLRIGFAAFPLSIAIMGFLCLISTRRLLSGLYMTLIVVGTGTTIRVLGTWMDHSSGEGGRLLAPELILLVLIILGIRLELARHHSEA